MKIPAAFMVLAALTTGAGGALEFAYFGSDATLGPPATIVGMTNALAAIGWSWRNRALEPNT